MSEQDAQSAHAGGEMAAQQRQDHYLANIAGQGTGAGDPMPAASALQSAPDSQDSQGHGTL